MDPEVIRQWQRILRDTLIVLVGSFLLIFEAVVTDEPNVTIIAAALACYGLPTVLRLEKSTNGDNGDSVSGSAPGPRPSRTKR